MSKQAGSTTETLALRDRIEGRQVVLAVDVAKKEAMAKVEELTGSSKTHPQAEIAQILAVIEGR